MFHTLKSMAMYILQHIFNYINNNFCIYSSLRSVIEKPPIGGKEILPLTTHQLAGFRLHPGPVCIFISFLYAE